MHGAGPAIRAVAPTGELCEFVVIDATSSTLAREEEDDFASGARLERSAVRMKDAGKITRRLLERYPEPKLALRFSNPLELLIAVILSAQCTDARVNEVTKALFQKYRTATDYAQADLSSFEQEIRPTGFYRNKAKTVIACCKRLLEEYGGEVPSTADAMMTLPGVGRKTANMVLGNAFGEQAIAVDTHVLRVANRLGLVNSRNADKVEAALTEIVPALSLTAFTNAMILHGRETCTARKPHCGECVLYALCAWPEKAAHRK